MGIFVPHILGEKEICLYNERKKMMKQNNRNKKTQCLRSVKMVFSECFTTYENMGNESPC